MLGDEVEVGEMCPVDDDSCILVTLDLRASTCGFFDGIFDEVEGGACGSLGFVLLEYFVSSRCGLLTV